VVTQRKQLLFGRIARGVLSLGGVGKFGTRAKDMAMGIDSACG
jgi:hypothetical protein